MAEAIAKASQAIGGATKGVGGTIGGLLKLIFFVKARWTITILLLMFYSYGALQQSIEQKNFSPFIFEIGGRMASADETLYWKLKDVEANNWKLPSKSIKTDESEGFWRDIKSIMAKGGFLLDIFSTGWFVYIVLYFFYRMIRFHNDSEKAFAWMVAVVIVILLQSLYGMAMLYLNYEGGLEEIGKYKEIGFAMTPLKGVTFLAINSPKIFGDALMNSAVPFVEKGFNESINQTVSA